MTERKPFNLRNRTTLRTGTDLSIMAFFALKQFEAEIKKFLSTNSLEDIHNPITRSMVDFTHHLFGSRSIDYESDKFIPEMMDRFSTIAWELFQGGFFASVGIGASHLVSHGISKLQKRQINPVAQLGMDAGGAISSYIVFTQIFGPYIHDLLQTEAPITIPLLIQRLGQVAQSLPFLTPLIP